MYSKKKKKERNCKGSVSSIVKFIYSVKRKRKREKRERRKRTVERHFCLMFSRWLNIAGILKRKEKRRRNCFLNFSIICLVVAY